MTRDNNVNNTIHALEADELTKNTELLAAEEATDAAEESGDETAVDETRSRCYSAQPRERRQYPGNKPGQTVKRRSYGHLKKTDNGKASGTAGASGRAYKQAKMNGK